MCTAPPIAAEIRSDISCAYRAHAGAKLPAYGCIPKLDVIDPQYLDLLIES